MRNHINYYENGTKIKAWYEQLDNGIDYWKSISGISYPLTRRRYLNAIKKTERQEYESIGTQKNPQT